jgi:flagellar motor switch protein FliN
MTQKAGAGARIDLTVIERVEVLVEAYVGKAQMTVSELILLGKGDVVALDYTIGQDIELKMNGTIIAYGELVTVDDKFAVRITDIFEHSAG